jgi:hypothetical protein
MAAFIGIMMKTTAKSLGLLEAIHQDMVENLKKASTARDAVEIIDPLPLKWSGAFEECKEMTEDIMNWLGHHRALTKSGNFLVDDALPVMAMSMPVIIAMAKKTESERLAILDIYYLLMIKQIKDGTSPEPPKKSWWPW